MSRPKIPEDQRRVSVSHSLQPLTVERLAWLAAEQGRRIHGIPLAPSRALDEIVNNAYASEVRMMKRKVRA